MFDIILYVSRSSRKRTYATDAEFKFI